MGEGETSDMELVLQSHAHVKNIVLSYVKPMVLKCAMELGIPRLIHEHCGPMSAAQLAAGLSLPPSKAPNLAQLMRVLEFSGFVTKKKEEEEGSYVLTPLSRSLLMDGSESFVLLSFLPCMISPLLSLTPWFRGHTDPTACHTANCGKSIWEVVGENPVINNIFNEAMAHDSRIVTPLLVSKCAELGFFEGVESFVDVGGGKGVVARSFAEAFPALKCTAFDRPQVVESMVSDNKVQFVGGNMFDYVPPSDTLLLKLILHDYDDENCLKILKNCKEAITFGEKAGKLIVVDIVINLTKGDTSKFVETQVLYDVTMMALSRAKERDEQEWKDLFAQAGFTTFKITPLTYLKSFIELHP